MPAQQPVPGHALSQGAGALLAAHLLAQHPHHAAVTLLGWRTLEAGHAAAGVLHLGARGHQTAGAQDRQRAWCTRACCACWPVNAQPVRDACQVPCLHFQANARSYPHWSLCFSACIMWLQLGCCLHNNKNCCGAGTASIAPSKPPCVVRSSSNTRCIGIEPACKAFY